MAELLTRGAIQLIISKKKPAKPVLQILDLEPIPSDTVVSYQVVLWDGQQANTFIMQGPNVNKLLNKKEIGINGLVRLDEYVYYEENTWHVIVVVRLTVLKKEGSLPGRLLQNRAVAWSAVGVPPAEAPSPPSSAGSARHAPVAQVVPIAELPGNLRFGYWTITATVMEKSEEIPFNTTRQGKFFEMYLRDQSGEIRAVAFDSNCDLHLGRFQVNKVYDISIGNVQRCNHGKTDYEIVLNSATKVREHQ